MTGERILIVANDAFDRPPESILVWTADFITTAQSVHVIAPLVASRVEWATDADAPARLAAEPLQQVLAHAEAAGVEATGEVTRDSPLDAVKTKLSGHMYDRIIVGVRENMNWQEKNLLSKIQSVTDIPVDAVVVPRVGVLTTVDSAPGDDGIRLNVAAGVTYDSLMSADFHGQIVLHDVIPRNRALRHAIPDVFNGYAAMSAAAREAAAGSGDPP